MIDTQPQVIEKLCLKMYQNLPVLFLRPTPEKSIHREIVSNFFPSKSNKTMANEIFCFFLVKKKK
jgi:hypothetical protein